jgi:hypothetical protein
MKLVLKTVDLKVVDLGATTAFCWVVELGFVYSAYAKVDQLDEMTTWSSAGKMVFLSAE